MARVNRFAAQRIDYTTKPLELSDLDVDPITQLSAWMSEAIDLGVPEANAMVVATVGSDGQPSTRNVLCKEITEAGVVFFTNYGSRKAIELANSPKVAATFYWLPMHRQINIRGLAKRCSDEVSNSYWESRSLGSQAASAASQQSQPLESREGYTKAVDDLALKAEAEGALERPSTWGGFEIEVDVFEFWQGGQDRMHDRFVYAKDPGAVSWKIERLYP